MECWDPGTGKCRFKFLSQYWGFLVDAVLGVGSGEGGGWFAPGGGWNNLGFSRLSAETFTFRSQGQAQSFGFVSKSSHGPVP